MRRKKKGRLLPIFLFVGVIAASIIGLMIARQRDIENPSAVANQDEVTRLTAKEAYEAQQDGSAVIVDTRSETQFAQGHIAGAINVPLDQIENKISELDPQTWYITYCT
jgi:ArsR family transcriptional regulator